MIRRLRLGILTLCIATLFAVAPAMAQGAGQAPNRKITKIAGDLYRFQNNFHFSVFLVTSEGVIVTDPINAAAAQWLKAEIAREFNRPIKYVVLSHDHADHISGGEVFADTAIVVAHANARRDIIGEKRATAVPQLTFDEKMTIHLGGKTVDLAYVGKNHSDNSIVMRFSDERALFAVDFIPVKAVGFRDFPDGYLAEWIESLKRVEAMDFDILAPGHGSLGTKADVTAHREYMQDLWDGVLAGIRAGKPLDQIKQELTLEKYKDWAQYKEFLPLNIEGMHRYLSLYRRPN